MAPPKLRLVLADDHRMVREALRRSLEPTFQVVATAADGAELLRALDACPADCLLLDLDLAGQHGLTLLPALRRSYPGLHIIVVTMHANRLIAATALREGASGFVSKDAGVEELSEAIRTVCGGSEYVSPRLSKSRHRLELTAVDPAFSRLTPRQQEILVLMGEGRSAARIAEALNVGPSTITFHKQNIMRVLGLDTSAALTQYAVLIRTASVKRDREVT